MPRQYTPRVQRDCLTCGSAFMVIHFRSKRAKYCSRACYRDRPDRLIAAFWDHIDRAHPDGCWPWMRGADRDGYGKVGNERAHRIAYRLTWGPIPRGLVVCHVCDNPTCCRPDHLALGTVAANNDDKTVKGRQARPIGTANAAAKLTEDTVREIRHIYAQGGIGQREIASRYGVGQMTVSLIVRRKRWAHVA